MKKVFLFLGLMLCAAVTFAQSYGILVNGTTYFAGTKVAENDGYTQYLAHVAVKSGDKLQLCDPTAKAVWAVVLDTYSEDGFTLNDDHYDATVTGCYDCYIKLSVMVRTAAKVFLMRKRRVAVTPRVAAVTAKSRTVC